ncbi:cysteine desulfurase family protein [Sneathiella sp.]|uniref:cysteine desulfurase family protein n=1 Tax=Sneathiella sp. TaxID=1964365 RepID=UPI003568AE26
MTDDDRQPRQIIFEGKPLTLPIYLDHQASTPVDERVADAMAPFWRDGVGNPHSMTHAFGARARDAIEIARTEIAALISANPHEIIFTSGATEANNLALLGIARANAGARHIISVTTEHEAILRPLEALAEEGLDITLLAVNSTGRINLDALEVAIRPETLLVSVMAANNETGTCQDLAAIGAICKKHGVTFHSDAAQGLGTEKIDVEEFHLSLLSLSGHKLYGPMGIGALYVRDRTRIKPQVVGGGQERNLRAGTLPTALCVGLGAACRIIGAERGRDAQHLRQLRESLQSSLSASLGEQVQFNGEEAPHIPGCLSVTLVGVDAEDLLHDLPALALSTGSACTSLLSEPSHVLRAMGLSAREAAATIRVGFGRSTTKAEVQYAACEIIRACQNLT